MSGIFASRSREAWSCGLLSTVFMGFLAFPAQASTIEAASFAQTAVVTHWSLPLGGSNVGAGTEPTFVQTGSGKTILRHDARAFGTRAASATREPGMTKAAPSNFAAANRPALAAEDLEARGVATYDREQPYRTPTDIKALEVAFHVLNTADAITTVVCVNRDDCQENNPLYGKRPSPIVVIGSKTAVSALHYLAMRSLLPDSPGLARALGWVSVTIQGTVVGLNMSQLF